MGIASSLSLAFSGVGTIALLLASKNISTELMNGLETSVSQNFVVGDEIHMSDDAQGFVTNLGTLGMEIEGEQ